MKIKLVVGDWSKDGHEKSEDIYIESNLSIKDLTKAYKKGVSIVGLDVQSEVAANYQDSNISKKDLDKLINAGLEIELDEDGDEFYLDENSYSEIWLFVAKLGNPAFEYSFLEAEEQLNIGGYGLFE